LHPPQPKTRLTLNSAQVRSSEAQEMAAFYYRDRDVVIGPLTGIELREAAFAGQLTSNTLVATSEDGPTTTTSHGRRSQPHRRRNTTTKVRRTTAKSSSPMSPHVVVMLVSTGVWGVVMLLTALQAFRLIYYDIHPLSVIGMPSMLPGMFATLAYIVVMAIFGSAFLANR
ncbi:MAG: hypothetical protein O3C40_34480, partial [Planctomycetota bacterium]|nr:hypothetical protein [Planctomycetota bacterium]